MNNNKLYLISEEDYIKHINEKVYLYSLVKQLTHHIGKLAPNRGTKTLSDMAKHYGASAEKLFRSWGIPMSYLVFADKDDLSTVMENELIEPEDAGYGTDSSKPLHITVSNTDIDYEMSWAKVQRQIAQLIKADNFFTEQEKEAFEDIDPVTNDTSLKIELLSES